MIPQYIFIVNSYPSVALSNLAYASQNIEQSSFLWLGREFIDVFL